MRLRNTEEGASHSETPHSCFSENQGYTSNLKLTYNYNYFCLQVRSPGFQRCSVNTKGPASQIYAILPHRDIDNVISC